MKGKESKEDLAGDGEMKFWRGVGRVWRRLAEGQTTEKPGEDTATQSATGENASREIRKYN